MQIPQRRKISLGDPAPVVHDREHSRGQSLVEFALILPIALILLLSVADMARIYTTMAAVESAAREAADYGAFTSDRWTELNRPLTVAEMTRRACVASADLNDYVGPDTACDNPTVTYYLSEKNTNGSTSIIAKDQETDCSNRGEPGDKPCRVTVDVEHEFQLLLPVGFDFNGVRLGLPETLTFTRSSTFVNSDFEFTNEE